MRIVLERIYDPPTHEGYRVLADRVWPRGITKQRAALDEWCKDLAPTTHLRKWFGHDPAKWEEFQANYLQELDGLQTAAAALLERASSRTLILLSGTKDTEHVHTVVLREFLMRMQKA